MNLKHKFLLTTTMAAGLLFGMPALAQNASTQTQPPETDQVETTPQEEEQASQGSDRVVVTGSRIRRTEFTSAQPLQVITAEEATLEGLVDTSEILQSSTVAATSGQINNYFTGFVTTGGPGVNTISLRGLGAQRTLVLINGRRAGPAGVRGTVGPADLNTIPGSQIERIEVLTDGASSIYGSDAVAGVVNIITRQNLDGGSAELVYNLPFEKGGEELRAGLSHGWTFDRGYLSLGADYYERSELTFGDREAFQCPQDQIYYDADLSQRADVIDPSTGQFKCYTAINNLVRVTRGLPNPANPAALAGYAFDYMPDPTAIAGGGIRGCDLNGWRFFAGGGSTAGAPTGLHPCVIAGQHPGETPQDVIDRRRAAYGITPAHSPRYDRRQAISPVTRTSFNAFGGYDLTSEIELFGELLYNKRESEQLSLRQLFPAVSPTHPDNPFVGTGIIAQLQPVIYMDFDSRQEVEYIRGVAGMRGSFDFGRGWDWDLAIQHSRSDGEYGGNFFYNDRVIAAQSTGTASGCNAAALLEPGPCVRVNWFNPNLLTNGQMTPQEAEFLIGYEVGNTVYEHTYIEGTITGELFDLPAGPIGSAFGFQVREESIDDQPGPEARRNNSWGLTSAQATTGEDTIKEVFAEFEIPVVRDMPLFDSLTLNLSGRLSDYDSYGDNSTYKVGLNWAITPDWRIRASQGTSFRAPALYELYLGNQTSFLGQTQIDPCINWQNLPDGFTKDNCEADGIPQNYTAAGTSSATIITGGGIGVLNPETADALSAGLIWTPGFVDLSVALDYFKIEVTDQVQQFSAASIVGGCYASETFATEPLCQLFNRRSATAPSGANQIEQVRSSYINIANQTNEGLDLNVRYTHDLGFGDLLINARASYILDWTSQLFTASTPTILNGRVGNPDWVANINARLDVGDWTGFYQVDLVPRTSNYWIDGTSSITFLGEPIFLDRAAEFYQNHSFSLRRRFDNMTVQFGIQNIFDEPPPYVSYTGGNRGAGNAVLSSQYDYLGRRAFLNIGFTW